MLNRKRVRQREARDEARPIEASAKSDLFQVEGEQHQKPQREQAGLKSWDVASHRRENMDAGRHMERLLRKRMADGSMREMRKQVGSKS